MWYNGIISAILRSPFHGLLSRDMLLLSYVGRKSGATYTVPLSYVRQDDTLLILSLRKRTWWRNLRGKASIRIQLLGQDRSAVGEVIEDDGEVIDRLRLMVAHRPELARLFNVSPAADTALDQESLRAAARDKVVIQVRLELASVQRESGDDRAVSG